VSLLPHIGCVDILGDGVPRFHENQSHDSNVEERGQVGTSVCMHAHIEHGAFKSLLSFLSMKKTKLTMLKARS
jgi:hypothetical protein